MERHPLLDAARRARSFFPLIAAAAFLLPPARLFSQCGRAVAPNIQHAFEQQKWAEVAQQAEKIQPRSAELDFEYGLVLARLHRLAEAHRALLAGLRQCPTDKRFPEELGGVAYEQKAYGEAARWLRRTLHLDPGDGYAANFLGTVYYLSGNLPAAVEAWNRINKPFIQGFDLDAHLRVHRLLVDRAFAFAPESVVRAPQLRATEARLDGLGIFPAYSLELAARPNGSFDAVFRAQERDGFGSGRLEALVSTLGGLPYETLYPSYANMHREAMNYDSLLRWDAQKRRVWVSLSAPPGGLPAWRWQVSGDWRGENWAIRRSFTGTAPVLGSLHLDREALGFGLTSYASGRLRWTVGGEVSHRTFTNVISGSALTASLVRPGYEIAAPASVDYRLLDLPARRFTLTTSASSAFGRMLSTPGRAFENLQGSALAHWLPGMEGDRWEVRQELRGGKIFGTVPFDGLYLSGMDRDDTDLWLRGDIATRDGRKGSAPMGDAYLLANTDLLRRMYGNGIFSVHAGPLLDIGRMGAPTPGLSADQWLFDPGFEARLTVLHTSVILSYGRDVRSGANAFYGSVAPPSALP